METTSTTATETTTPVETGATKADFDAFVPAGVNPAYAKKPAAAKEAKKEVAEPEVKEQTQETEQQKEEKKIAAALKKLKVKGKEIEVDENKYHEFAQKGAAATETWQEAARLKREAESFWKALKENPRAVLSDPNLGIDLKKVAEDLIWEELQEAKLSPEEKEYRKEKEELEKYRQSERERKAAEEEAKKRELDEHFAIDYDKKMARAIQESGLPKSTAIVRRMTDYVLHDVRNGIERDFSEYVDAVREDYIKDISELFSDLDGDALIKFLGDANIKKVRESDLKRIKTTTPKENHTFVPGKGMVPAQKQKKLSGEDWMRQVRKEMSGLK